MIARICIEILNWSNAVKKCGLDWYSLIEKLFLLKVALQAPESQGELYKLSTQYSVLR